MISKFIKYKKKAIDLRLEGHTYGEITEKIGKPIPKSTLTEWFKNIKLSFVADNRLRNVVSKRIRNAHIRALAANKKIRKDYLEDIARKVAPLKKRLDNPGVAKIALAMLYLGEGAKKKRGSLMFGNSDPRIIKLFLSLLRNSYDICESKFRCTLQCRDSQDIKSLEHFWSNIANVPLDQFYKARVDPRTLGKKIRNTDYKGVLRIDYFSADVYNEIIKIIEIICK